MKKSLSLVVLCLAVFAGNAFAAGDTVAKPKGKQQAKMSMCSKDAKAKGLKGAPRKEFMSSCLKAKA